jgi:sortase A
MGRPAQTHRAWLIAERFAWLCGVLCLAIWVGRTLSTPVVARLDVSRFAALQSVASRGTARVPNQSLWAPERVRAWHETLTSDAPAPLGVLRIPKIDLEVAILPGTSEWTLNRAVGHIVETALPGTDGNAAIAGHRDGFFRGLKDVGPGDLLELETLGARERYRVERVWIVNQEDVWVLDPTPARAVTLVTCYPFYYVGSAPQRYIVRAVKVETT